MVVSRVFIPVVRLSYGKGAGFKSFSGRPVVEYVHLGGV